MKLPSKLALALGGLIAGALTLAGELNLSHPLHQAIILVGAFLLFLLQPGGSSGPPTIPASVTAEEPSP